MSDSIKPTGSLHALRRLVHRLRAPGGCPWDRAQTPASLVRYVIEEAYEVADAIESGNPDELCEELGDLLLQVYLQAEIAEEGGQFTLNDVVRALSAKLIRRHPHVFAGLQVRDADEVNRNWERLKLAEKNGRSSSLDGIPRSLSSLARSQEIQRRLARAGFDWTDRRGLLDKLAEEIDELKAAWGARDATSRELGDVLFMLAKLATDAGLDADAALRRTLRRVENRYHYVERAAAARGAEVSGLPLTTQLALWDEAKRAEQDETA